MARGARLIALSLLCAAAGLMADAGTVIEPVHVVSVSTGEVQPDRAVVIRNGKIEAVQASGSIQGDGRLLRIDGQDGFLLPGLAEMHAHIPPHSGGEDRVRDVLTLFLANGVTTVRGMLGEPWHLELRKHLEDGSWTGPRLITSGPSFNGRSVHSPEQAVDRVRQQALAGYDFLKLHPGLEVDEFDALAQAAHAAGIPFAGHVSFAVGIEAALRSGQASIDHLDGYAQALVPTDASTHGVAPAWFGVNLATDMDPDLGVALARATARAGVWNVPTQALLEHTAGNRSLDELLARPGMRYVSPETRASWIGRLRDIRDRVPADRRDRFIEVRRQLIRQLHEAGAGILLGSDAPQIMNVPGFSLHEELEFMVLSGLSPLAALQSGTVKVGEFLDDPSHGCIAHGCRGDLVLLESNPLEEVSRSRGIIGVMRAGSWYGRESLDRMLDDVRSRGL